MVNSTFKPSMEQFPLINTITTKKSSPSCIPIISLTDPNAKKLIVKASEEFDFFKVINHGIPEDFIKKLESEASNFFSLPQGEKEKTSKQVVYGNKGIGGNGDVGWIEYLLMSTKFNLHLDQNSESFRCALSDYMTSVKRLACELLEMMADELRIQPRNVFSRLIMDEESDSVFRLNHYPPCPEDLQGSLDTKQLVGFGEHTDPQIISVMKANEASGYEILLKDGTWVSVPPDQNSVFVNIGDSLQVMTNGRFRSVRHRVLTNSRKSRLSMLYFGGPPMKAMIGPLPSLMEADQPSLYKELTWFEYITTAFKKPLAHDRIVIFEKVVAS